MKILGYLLAAGLALALLKAAIIAALTIGGLLIIWGAYFRTHQTFALLLVFLLYSLFAVQPLACLIVVALMFVAIKIADRRAAAVRLPRAPASAGR